MMRLSAGVVGRFKFRVIAFIGFTLSAMISAAVRGDIYVLNYASAPGNGPEGTISQYSETGKLINPAAVSGLFGPRQMALSGQDFYVVTYPNSNADSQNIGQYGRDGTTINSALISGVSYSTDKVAS